MSSVQAELGDGVPDRRKAAEVVADRVRSLIANGDLEPGDALPSETTLMEEFGVARPTMREAIRVLESDGLIRIQRGVHGGARIQDVDLDVLARRAGLYLQMHGTTIGDLTEAQSLIEPGAVGLAAVRCEKRDLRELRALVKRIGASDDRNEFADAAADFHLCLFRVSGNRVLGLFAAVIRSLLRQEYRRRLETVDEEVWRVVAESTLAWYPQLVDLIEVGDAEGAQDLWTRHQRMAQEEAGRFVETHGGEPIKLFP